MYSHAIIGLEGTALTHQEKRWLQHKTPKGVILFKRNIESASQVKSLLHEARHYAGQALWAAIDEEGGRVNRLPFPPFNHRVQAADFGKVFDDDADMVIKGVFSDAYQVGQALLDLGFTHNCAPVLDILYALGDPIIGNRAYSESPEVIAKLGAAAMFGLHDAGIQAIGKHFPGHGRANADSHLAMPVVDADLPTILAEAAAFPALLAKGLRHVMTAHVRYPNIHPDIATFSRFWLHEILRSDMQFDGDIWSDDLCMQGCGMDVPEAATAALTAGCTVLLVCEVAGVQALMDACQ